MKKAGVAFGLLLALGLPLSAFAFEGRIYANVSQNSQVASLLYTVGTNCLRVERTETNRPYACNLVDLQTGDIALLFPQNRSFARVKAASQGGPPGGNPPGMPAMPMPGEKLELTPTGQTTNLLGCACAGYEIKQRGETMQIWATDGLLPFQPWLPGQPHHLGPRRIGQEWGELLKARKLFPLLATLRLDNGQEQYRFEVKTIAPGSVTDAGGTLFLAPTNYFETRAMQR